MSVRVDIDKALLLRARRASGLASDSEVIRAALESLLRHHHASVKLAGMGGKIPGASVAPRQRARSETVRRVSSRRSARP